MPRPCENERSTPSISWLRTVSDSPSSETTRASEYEAPAARAASTAWRATSITGTLPSLPPWWVSSLQDGFDAPPRGYHPVSSSGHVCRLTTEEVHRGGDARRQGCGDHRS